MKGLCNQISSICSHLHKNTLFSYLHIVKVVCVVKIKLCFTDQLFCNLIMLIKWCKIQYLNLDKVLVIWRNQVICLKNWWNFFTRFCLINVYQKVCGIFWTPCRGQKDPMNWVLSILPPFHSSVPHFLGNESLIFSEA